MNIRSMLRATAAAGLLVTVTAPVTGAHTQVVQPPSKDTPVVVGPISNPWAQAHCNAAAPAVVLDASKGVVRFNPGTALPCPLTPNPGGEIHGD